MAETAFQGYKAATDRYPARINNYVIYPEGLASNHAEALQHTFKERVMLSIGTGVNPDGSQREIPDHRLAKITGSIFNCGFLGLKSSYMYSKQRFNAYAKWHGGAFYWNFVPNPIADLAAPSGTCQLGRKFTYRITNNKRVLEFEDQGRISTLAEQKLYDLSTALHTGGTGGSTLGGITDTPYARSAYKEGNYGQCQITNSIGAALLGITANSAFEFVLECVIGENDTDEFECYRPSKMKYTLTMRGLQVSKLNLRAFNTCLREDVVVAITLMNADVLTINQVSLIGEPAIGDDDAVVNIRATGEIAYNSDEGSPTCITFASGALTLSIPTS
jgi:hypothetical protein